VTAHNEDAAWKDIVDHYGDRPLLDPDERPEDVRAEAQPEPEVVDLTEQEFRATARTEPPDRFVPPPPPPLPRVAPDRLAAWAGVFLSPLILLVATVLRLPLPTVVAWLLIAAFLGGFGYLVHQMPRGSRDPFDDGARL
jgi:hypothetical protein